MTPHGSTDRLIERLNRLDLSPFERKVRDLLAIDLSKEMIADVLGVPVKAVKDAIRRIRRKMETE